MADMIRPEVMQMLLDHQNWQLAVEGTQLVLDPEQRFEMFRPIRPSLVVPVDLQALYVPNGHAERYVKLPMALGPDAARDGSPPFQTPVARPRGVHLHWALPDGLLRGEMGETGGGAGVSLSLPPLPDRWLVVRMTGEKDARRITQRGWVLESDGGRVFDLASWPGGTPLVSGAQVAAGRLDGMIGGSPGWTSGYDAALNRFAFHDPLADLDPARVQTGLASYVVIGWWSSTDQDPIGQQWSRLAISRRLAEYGWQASPAPVNTWGKRMARQRAAGPAAAPVRDDGDGGDGPIRAADTVALKHLLRRTTSQASLATGFHEYRPDHVTVADYMIRLRTVLHGCVYGVPIRGGVGRDLAPADASAIGLSMAPTLPRLMAAQAARGMGLTSTAQREAVETLITAVANGAIQTLGQRDGIVLLDEAEHADGFRAFHGPETYEDVVVEGDAADLAATRKSRSRRAAAMGDAPVRADMIWQGGDRVMKYSASIEAARNAATVGRTAKQYRETGKLDAGAALALAMDPSATAYASAAAAAAAAGGGGGPVPPRTRRIARPGPRYHLPVAPVIGLRNFGRSNRFLGDGRFSEDGTLLCRWTEELAAEIGDDFRAEALLSPIGHAGLPQATNRLLQHSLLFDPHILPWTFNAIMRIQSPDRVGATQNRLRGEIALRYGADGIYDGYAPILRADDGSGGGGRRDAGASDMLRAQISEELRRFSVFEGIDPSPVGITSWAQPWSPIWLEWQIELTPAPGGLDGWELGRIEFDTPAPAAAAAAVAGVTPVTLSGRSALTTGLTQSWRGAIQTYLIAEAQRDAGGEGEINASHADALADLAAHLALADMASVTLDRVNDLWLALDHGPDGQTAPPPSGVAQPLRDAGLPRLLSSGQLRLTRARLIDSFGRYRDLAVDKLVLPVALDRPAASGAVPAMALPPRLALPARLMWRFIDPADDGPDPAEARQDQADPSRMISPVAGYILPDFMDESLEFFDAGGNPLGEVLEDAVTGALTWEGGVGREGPASSLPMHGLPPAAAALGRIAQGMIDADTAQRGDPATVAMESPLSAFLRAVDTTMWGIDQSLVSAGATVAGLIGRPIAVVTAQLWLDVPTDLALTSAFGRPDEARALGDHLLREAVFDALKSLEFPIRLGEFAKGHDGLYGYFLQRDFSRFHLIDKQIASAAPSAGRGLGYQAMLGVIGGGLGANFVPPPDPLDLPYIDAAGQLGLHSGQRVHVTLLMHPAARVHATCGILPRKALELQKAWVADGLARVAPSARVGPVLIDPDRVRLPKIAAFGNSQGWTRRDSPITWRNDPILSASQAAILPDGMVSVEEGYIRITPDSAEDGS